MKLFLSLLLASFFIFPASFSAQSIDLIWEGDSYTPPFYEGGVPWSSQSYIRLWAIPQGFSNPSSLIYRWTKSELVLGSFSGVGKNTLILSDSKLSKPQNFRVEIMSPEDDILAVTGFTIVPHEPEMLIYENHPLYGLLLNRAIKSDYELFRDEVTFSAFPIFLGIKSLDQESLSTTWRSNGKEIGQGPEITLRKPEGVEGSTSVSTKVTDQNILMWPLEKNFLIQFGNNE